MPSKRRAAPIKPRTAQAPKFGQSSPQNRRRGEGIRLTMAGGLILYLAYLYFTGQFVKKSDIAGRSNGSRQSWAGSDCTDAAIIVDEMSAATAAGTSEGVVKPIILALRTYPLSQIVPHTQRRRSIPGSMSFLGLGPPPSSYRDQPPPPLPLPGTEYLVTLHKYLLANLPRLAPQRPRRTAEPTFLQQSYTLLTLGLDPSSAPLSRNVKVPLTLGFGQADAGSSSNARPSPPIKPLCLRLPPDRLLYLLLRWQSLGLSLPHVSRTDEPVPPGVAVASRGARDRDMTGAGAGIGGASVLGGRRGHEGDAESVRSWVGSVRSVSLRSVSSGLGGWTGWGRKEEVDEDKILLALYEIFTVLPSLLIHPPFSTDRQIAELVDAGGYTQLGGIDVRVPLDVLRNLQTLELEAYDPRALLIPPNPALRSLTVRDVQDADDWVEQLLIDHTLSNSSATPATSDSSPDTAAPIPSSPRPRFPNLRHLSLPHGSLLDLPTLPLTALTHLDLSHNLLESLPTSLASMHSLQSLNLSDNVITSVRSAPSVLGNVQTLVLARNRIDCLIGLERVKGLQRVDLRGNAIEQWEEVGRLADLPLVKEVYWEGNPGWSDDGRVELGVMFAEHAAEVLLDGREWTWSEKRKVESVMQARGIVPRSSRASALGHGHAHAHPPLNGQTRSNEVEAEAVGEAHVDDAMRTPSHSRQSSAGPKNAPPQTQTQTQANYNPPPPPTPQRLQGPSSGSVRSQRAPTTTSSPASSAGTSQHQQRKRRPARRVINLDEGDTPSVPEDAAVIGGSMRLPAKSRFGTGGSGEMVSSGTGEDGTTRNGRDVPARGNGQAEADGPDGEVGADGATGGNGRAPVTSVKVRKKERRRVSASMFEPNTS